MENVSFKENGFVTSEMKYKKNVKKNIETLKESCFFLM